MTRATVCNEMGELVVGEFSGGGIEKLRGVRHAGWTRGRHGGGQGCLRGERAANDNGILLGEEVGIVGADDRLQCGGTLRGTEERVGEPVSGQCSGIGNAELEGRLPGKKECGAAGADAGKRCVAVHALEQVGHTAAPAHVGAIGGNCFPCVALIEM